MPIVLLTHTTGHPPAHPPHSPIPPYPCTARSAHPATLTSTLTPPAPIRVAQVSSRPVFLNENPFPTRKFTNFLPQLPLNSSIAQLWHGGCDACDTCAVVGASGSSLQYAHGPLIDGHQVVLRPNWLLTKGFESVVGTRTNINLFFGVEGMIEQFDTEMSKLPKVQRALGLVTPGERLSYLNLPIA